MSSRTSRDEHYLRLVELEAQRSTCARRAVAAIITDSNGIVLGMGHNGVPRGWVHCTDKPCEGIHDPKGNTDRCYAVHAEQNALIQCHDVERAHSIYVTCSPCFTCAKLIANTGIKRIVVREVYPDVRGMDILANRKISIVLIPNGKSPNS